MKLEPELRDEFMAEAQALDQPASQIVRQLMREFIVRQRDAREYDDFIAEKVRIGREDFRAGRWRTNEEVERVFAAKRPELARKPRKERA